MLRDVTNTFWSENRVQDCAVRPVVMAMDYLNWEAQILNISRKISQNIGALWQLTLPAKRTFYVSVIAADLEYGSNAFCSSLSSASKEKLIHLSLKAWCPHNLRSHERHLTPSISSCVFPPSSTAGRQTFCFHLRTHSLSSTFPANEFSVLDRSNARTQSVTRGRSLIYLPFPAQCLSSSWYNLFPPYLFPTLELSAVFPAASLCCLF